ncbi:MAG TPA: response regulator transcription factor [Candidatus Limnocylindrales bacterium]|nr:response regulator transcription factor [Candidatus Limnocylindrales bacterium]
MTERRRVVLIDDHEMARRGLESMLSTANWIDVVGDADDCAGGLAAIERFRPDIVLLDIRMPGTDGLACLDRIKARADPVAVVMVTLYDDRRYVLEAIRRGAAGYLLKDASTDDVIATLQRVADGQLAIDPQLLREALTTRDDLPARATPRQRAEAYRVTPREHDVLALVAEGLTNKEIGSRLSISEDTVKKHVQNIIWKLRAADRTQAAITAFRMGLLEDA